MPGSITSAFSEPEDFEAALRADGCAGLLVTGRGEFRAQLTQVALHGLRLSAAEERLSRIAFLAVPADTVLLTFPMNGAALPICGGIAARPGEIVTLSPSEQVHARTDGLSHAGAIWLPVNALVRYGVALTGGPFTIPPAVQRWRPQPSVGRLLRSLHAAAIGRAAAHPKALVDIETAHGLEQQLIHAVVECLAGGSVDTDTGPRRRRQNIMVLFERLLHAQPDRALTVPEICTALDVSERLLRDLCAEHLGMGPIAYDRLRRMSLVRRTLRHGNGVGETVSTVARRYGFRSSGRFSVKYRSTFGEAPSATLRRSQDRSILHITTD
jgi:AraC-like DNA-binding protein